MKNCQYLIFCLFLFMGCGHKKEDPNLEIEKRCTAFAEAYFNYDFESAQKLVTPDSRKWLQFVATNISQADVDLINEQEVPATVSVELCECVNDSTSIVTISVHDFYCKNSIGKAGTIVEEALFCLTMVKQQDGKHYVKMAGLPRSEKRSRD